MAKHFAKNNNISNSWKIRISTIHRQWQIRFSAIGKPLAIMGNTFKKWKTSPIVGKPLQQLLDLLVSKWKTLSNRWNISVIAKILPNVGKHFLNISRSLDNFAKWLDGNSIRWNAKIFGKRFSSGWSLQLGEHQKCFPIIFPNVIIAPKTF